VPRSIYSGATPPFSHHDLHEGKFASLYFLCYMGVKIWSLTPREEYRRRAFLNKAIRWILSLREKNSEEDWTYCIISSSSQNFTRVMESIWDGRRRTVAQGVSRRPFTAEDSLPPLYTTTQFTCDFWWAKWHRERMFSAFMWDIPVCGEYKLVQLIINNTQWNTSYCFFVKNNGEQGVTCFGSWEPSSGLQIRYK